MAKTYPTPVTDQREMAGWMQREEDAYQKGYQHGRANARKEMARELLDEIKYSTEGYEDDDVINMIMVSLARIEDRE